MKKIIAALLLLLAAGSARAETVLNRGNGAEPDTLDPAQAGMVMEINILGDLMEGLVTRDAAARPIPGIAERYAKEVVGHRELGIDCDSALKQLNGG